MFILRLAAIIVILGFVSGCATGRSNLVMENQRMRTQISTLENTVREKDLEIESLETELNKINDRSMAVEGKKDAMAKSSKSKNDYSLTNVQIALKNAGFDPGPIDGRMGKKTKSAVRNFQKSQGLTADGIVGNRTWERLKEFLNSKIK